MNVLEGISLRNVMNEPVLEGICLRNVMKNMLEEIYLNNEMNECVGGNLSEECDE